MRMNNHNDSCQNKALNHQILEIKSRKSSKTFMDIVKKSPQIIVQRCQIAAPRWPNDISSVMRSSKTGPKTSSVASAVWRYSQWRPLSDHVERIFVHIEEAATFGFNRTALRFFFN